MQEEINEPAGFMIRLGAGILDAIIIGIPLSILGYVIAGSAEGNWVTNILSLVYAIFLPVYWHGYVVGKRIAGIRIIKVTGEPVGIGNMLLRTIVGGLIYTLTLGIGIIVSAFMVIIREDKRAIHDFVAGTYVTRLEPNEVGE